MPQPWHTLMSRGKINFCNLKCLKPGKLQCLEAAQATLTKWNTSRQLPQPWQNLIARARETARATLSKWNASRQLLNPDEILPRFHRAKLKTGNFWWRLTVSANLVSLQEAQVLFETAFTDAGCTLAHDHGLQIIRGPNHRLEGSVLLGCERLAWDFVDLRFALSFS